MGHRQDGVAAPALAQPGTRRRGPRSIRARQRSCPMNQRVSSIHAAPEEAGVVALQPPFALATSLLDGTHATPQALPLREVAEVRCQSGQREESFDYHINIQGFASHAAELAASIKLRGCRQRSSA